MILAMLKSRRHLKFGLPAGPWTLALGLFASIVFAAFLVTVTVRAQSGGTVTPQPDKNRAQKSYQAGRRAEQSGDWKTAYADYSEATTYAPTNKEYPLLREHARFQVIQA